MGIGILMGEGDREFRLCQHSTYRFSAEAKAERPQHCYMPFGSGPRNCIGMRFALLEAKMALIEILQKFSFIRAPDTQVATYTCSS